MSLCEELSIRVRHRFPRTRNFNDESIRIITAKSPGSFLARVFDSAQGTSKVLYKLVRDCYSGSFPQFLEEVPHWDSEVVRVVAGYLHYGRRDMKSTKEIRDAQRYGFASRSQ